MKIKTKIITTLLLYISIQSIFGFGKSEIKDNGDMDKSTAVVINQLDAESGAEFISVNKPFILDVRTEQEYKTGHLEGSYLLPVQVLQDQLSLIEKYKNEDVFVYCRSGNRSMTASYMLIEAGFTRVYNLQGGINAWTSEGYPVEVE